MWSPAKWVLGLLWKERRREADSSYPNRLWWIAVVARPILLGHRESGEINPLPDFFLSKPVGSGVLHHLLRRREAVGRARPYRNREADYREE